MGCSLVFYYILLTDRLIMLVCKHNYTPSTYYGLAPSSFGVFVIQRCFFSTVAVARLAMDNSDLIISWIIKFYKVHSCLLSIYLSNKIPKELIKKYFFYS